MSGWLNFALFGIYPYVALSVLLLGSLIRFDQSPYTWKSDSSQLLRRRRLGVGSNLFHYGVLVVVIGHFVGFLLPDRMISWLISPRQHALLAMMVGGLAGTVAIVGLSILIHRRLADPRIRMNSHPSDIAVVFLLWAQLALGLLTVPFSAGDMSGGLFETLVAYVQGIVTLHPGVATLMPSVPFVYKLHILLGFTIFLISPFTRMIHVWSAPIWYLGREGYQIARTRHIPATSKGRR